MACEYVELADRSAAAEAIRRMGEEDLRFLNRLIVERLKLIHQARNTAMPSSFSVGDRVSFQSSTGVQKTGIVARLNRKTAGIVTDDGQQWNAHPAFLSPADPDIIRLPQERHAWN